MAKWRNGEVGYLFNLILYQPLLSILFFIYEHVPGKSFGLAIILLTILIKLILYPLGSKAIKSQKALASLQPKVKEIQEKYKDNKEEQGRQLIELYKKEKINPFSGILPLLIQTPILIALYWVFRSGIASSQSINPIFLGMNLSKPSYILAAIVAVFQFFQAKMAFPKTEKAKNENDFSAQLQKQMLYFTPVLMFLILLSLPSALGVYFLTTTLFSIIQQKIYERRNKEIN